MNEELERTIRDLQQALDDIAKKGVMTEESMSKVNAARRRLVDQIGDEADARETSEQKLKRYAQTVVRSTEVLTASTNSIRSNRENFESLNPAIRASGAVLAAGSSVVGSALETAGQAITGAGVLFGPKGALAGLLAGGLISGIGRGLGLLSEETSQLAVQFGEFATAEMQRVVSAFRQVGSVGAIGAGGMQRLGEQAIMSGLSLEQFSKVMGQVSQATAFSVGTTVDGAEAIAQLTANTEQYRNEFRALGLGLEETSEYLGDYLLQSRQLGRTQQRDYKSTAEAAAAYVFELDELARITGLSRQEASKELKAQMSNVRFRASLAGIEDKTAVENIRSTSVVLSTLSKELGVGFQDAFGGAGTEAARKFLFATGDAGNEIIANLKSGALSQTEALAQIQQAVGARFESLGGYEFAARVGKLPTFVQDILLGMVDITQAANLQEEATKRAAESQNEARQASDDLTKQVVGAQENLQKLAQALDAIAFDKLLPLSAGAIDMFTDALLDGIDFINDKLDIPITDEDRERRRQEREAQRKAAEERKQLQQGPDPFMSQGLSSIDTLTIGNSNNIVLTNPNINNNGVATVNTDDLNQLIGTIQTVATASSQVMKTIPLGIRSTETANFVYNKPVPKTQGFAEYKENVLAGIGTGSISSDAVSSTSGPSSRYNGFRDSTNAFMDYTKERDTQTQSAGVSQDSIAAGKQASAMDQQLAKLDTLVTLMQRNVETSNKLLRAYTS